LPAAGGQESPNAGTDEAKHGRKYGLSLVTGADDGLRRAVIIDGRTGSEACARSDGGANERVAATMPWAARRYPLDVLPGESLVTAFGVDDDRFVAYGLKLTFVGFLVAEHNLNLLARR